MRQHLKAILHDESGANLVEYGLLVILIAIVALTAIAATGTQLNTLFERIAPAFG